MKQTTNLLEILPIIHSAGLKSYNHLPFLILTWGNYTTIFQLKMSCLYFDTIKKCILLVIITLKSYKTLLINGKSYLRTLQFDDQLFKIKNILNNIDKGISKCIFPSVLWNKIIFFKKIIIVCWFEMCSSCLLIYFTYVNVLWRINLNVLGSFVILRFKAEREEQSNKIRQLPSSHKKCV